MIFLLVTVLLAPWHGAALPTTPGGGYQTKAYAMTVRGHGGERVSVRADGVARGWIAAFCTARVCSPFRSTVVLNRAGIARLEFSLIRTDPTAARSTSATIRADNRNVAHVRS